MNNHRTTYDDLWRLVHSIRGCAASQQTLIDSRDDGAKEQLSGLIGAVEYLAERAAELASTARDECPWTPPDLSALSDAPDEVEQPR
ncbi:hypothetical protein [uncultured Lamprocystis sp.]|jgi:hypothetical protein|uniref:hypothetical protein n=1 Tax=uncultured Lamprocystis sp. TaxID=543132 RepID=UPI0025E72043|nr:hypothetical protein [uncultured Lamprocystis sp.]